MSGTPFFNKDWCKKLYTQNLQTNCAKGRVSFNSVQPSKRHISGSLVAGEKQKIEIDASYLVSNCIIKRY